MGSKTCIMCDSTRPVTAVPALVTAPKPPLSSAAATVSASGGAVAASSKAAAAAIDRVPVAAVPVPDIHSPGTASSAEAAVRRYNDALAALVRANNQASSALRAASVVACERYDAAAHFKKWSNHFIAKHNSFCALAGSQETAVSRAERRSRDDKGKVIAIDERCRIRPINDHDGRKFAMGIFYSTSHPEVVLAFEDAALRDAWVAMLQVHACSAALVGLSQQNKTHIQRSFIRLNRRFRPRLLQRSRRRRKSRFVTCHLSQLLLTRLRCRQLSSIPLRYDHMQ